MHCKLFSLCKPVQQYEDKLWYTTLVNNRIRKHCSSTTVTKLSASFQKTCKWNNYAWEIYLCLVWIKPVKSFESYSRKDRREKQIMQNATTKWRCEKKKKKTKQWKCVLTGKMPKITLINTPADPSSQISHWLEFMERSIKLPNLHLYNFTLNFKGGQYFPLEAEYSTNKKVQPSPYQVIILFIDDKATTSPKN